ncbi:MAG: DUF1801 domain-containing protein [Thermoflavifilum sp.]|nr:DUF1801 domain-containing protein [Thermoflavifilum sp.]
MDARVDHYVEHAEKWQDEIRLLRTIVLECGLQETFKWNCPCYVYQNKNIVVIHTFKNYCALLFFKGSLLPDPHHLLIQQTPHVQLPRQIRFTDISTIQRHHQILKNYILEAINVEKLGIQPHLHKNWNHLIPKEFEEILQQQPEIKKAFYALTPGRQRAYLLYFSQAKRITTRMQRINMSLPKILHGKGLHDR